MHPEGLDHFGRHSRVTVSNRQNINLPSNGIRIVGNFIGTNANGTAVAATPITTTGIDLENSVLVGTVIGGTAPGDRNIISGITGVGTSGDGIVIAADSAQVLGNFIGLNAAGNAAIPNSGAGIEIAGDTTIGGGLASTDTKIGGTAPGAGNVISGNKGQGILRIGTRERRDGLPNVVQGNFIGTDSMGAVALPNRGGIEGYGLTVGGTAAGARNVISGNTNAGVILTSSIIEGNFIGTDVTGTKPLGNTAAGAHIRAATRLGGAAPGAGNLISGNGSGVLIAPTASNNANRGGSIVQGNLIGTDVTGTLPLPNASYGITIGRGPTLPYVTLATVGGTDPGAGNVIAHNRGPGIQVLTVGIGDPGSDPPPSTSNTILSNSIFANEGLGIDLNADGVTPNDASDADIGPNALQNYPVLSFANSAEGKTTIAGSLHTTASTAVLLQFFSSAARDALGFGEGETLIGSVTVTTDANGNAAFNAELPVAVPSGRFISATATVNLGSSANQTSEFSNAVRVNGSALVNLSTRLAVQTGENVLIAGFIITGNDAKKLLLRAIGPSLPVSGALANPILDLFDSAGEPVATNDNWRDNANAQEITDSGIPPTDDREAALLVSLSPGFYTAVLRGANDTTGHWPRGGLRSQPRRGGKAGQHQHARLCPVPATTS